MKVGFELVDVFAEEPFSGNQLCVVADARPELAGEDMQCLAREIGFSETTFVTDVHAGGYDVRIFTPTSEIPFAGHPTLGTAFVLAAAGSVSTSPVQSSAAGDVAVTVDLEHGSASMRQLPPAFGDAFEERDEVALAAGLDAAELDEALPLVPVSTGLAHLMVPVRDEAALRRATRDSTTTAVCARAGVESLYLFTIRRDGDVVARMFDTSTEIGEDPATGSAAGPLGAYLSAHGRAGMPGRVTIFQGEQTGRPSVLRVTVARAIDGWSIDVEGRVHRVGSGAFELTRTP